MCKSELKIKPTKKSSMDGRSCSSRKWSRLQQLRCSKCKVAHAAAYWPRSQRWCRRGRQTHLVCKACREQGFHPRGLEALTCQSCKGNFGSNRFNKALLSGYKRYKKRPRTTLRCIQCVAQESEEKARATPQITAIASTQADGGKIFTRYMVHTSKAPMEAHLVYKGNQTDQTSPQRMQTGLAGKRCQHDVLRCSKCNMAYEDACWTRIQRQNHRASQTKLVCKACQAQGFHPRNLEAYTCQTCNSNFGARRFKKVLLNNYKQRPCVRLECIQCVAQKREKKESATAQYAEAPLLAANATSHARMLIGQQVNSIIIEHGI